MSEVGMGDFNEVKGKGLKEPEIFEDLISTLGSPFSRGRYYAIYNADVLEFMECIPNETMDLTITSPPYNIGKEYEKKLPLESYVDWVEKWLEEVYRVTTSSGAFWLNLGYVNVPGIGKAVPLPYLIWERVPFYLIQEVVWNYGAGVAGKNFLSPRNEKFLWYVKDQKNYTFNLDEIRDPDVKYPNQKKNGKFRCNSIGKNPSDVWSIAKVTSGKNRKSKERAPHPAQYPVDLIDRIVKGFSNKGEVVFDPFFGSGSTGEGAIKNGRYVIGLDLNPDYCLYAKDRLEEAEREFESSLF